MVEWPDFLSLSRATRRKGDQVSRSGGAERSFEVIAEDRAQDRNALNCVTIYVASVDRCDVNKIHSHVQQMSCGWPTQTQRTSFELRKVVNSAEDAMRRRINQLMGDQAATVETGEACNGKRKLETIIISSWLLFIAHPQLTKGKDRVWYST